MEQEGNFDQQTLQQYNMPKCTHRGCEKQFNDAENTDKACVYHSGAPIFHEGKCGDVILNTLANIRIERMAMLFKASD